jgi:hypothetical protein
VGIGIEVKATVPRNPSLCFVSGHDFSRATTGRNGPGFSPCHRTICNKFCRKRIRESRRAHGRSLHSASAGMTIHLGNYTERSQTTLSSRPERSVVEGSAVRPSGFPNSFSAEFIADCAMAGAKARTISADSGTTEDVP